MAKIIKLSKTFIIMALRDEPAEHLFPGFWVNFRGASRHSSIRNTASVCQVCAVGAIVRRALDPDAPVLQIDLAANTATGRGMYKITRNDYDFEDIMDEPGTWASRLSQAFEGLCEETGVLDEKDEERQVLLLEQVRQRLMLFVKEYFPDTTEWAMGDTDVGEGVEIVRVEQ